MNGYRVVYQCGDGYKDEVSVYAANRVMAFVIFKDLGIEDVAKVEIFRVNW